MTNSILTLTDEALMSLLDNRYDAAIIEPYYQKATNNELSFPNQDSKIKFLMILIEYYDNKLFRKTSVDPLDFFGLTTFNTESEYYKYNQLLKKTRNEILICLNKDVYIPTSVISDFYARYAHAMFSFGNHLTALELCQEALKYNPDNSLSLFIKSCIVEYCYINKNHSIYNVALTNYQKALIDKCDPTKTWIDKRIFSAVYNVIDYKMQYFNELTQCIKLKLAAENYEKTKEIDSSWTEEKDFYLRHSLFLNPINIFDVFLSAQNEDFDDLSIGEAGIKYFYEIVEDYKMCRKSLFEYQNGTNNNTRYIAMTYSYTYTIFDKIVYLIQHVYNLESKTKLYFSKQLFELEIKEENIKFGEIKNDNILPLFLLAIDVNDPQDENSNGKMNIISIESQELRLTRNKIEHRSLALVEDNILKRNFLILLKLARNAILHAFMLIHSCSLDDAKDKGKVTTIGTTFYQAILDIVKDGDHHDLIK